MTTDNRGVSRYLDNAPPRMLANPAWQPEPTGLRGTGYAADGMVQVKVGPGGALADLYLDPRVMRLDSGMLTDAILEAVGHAEGDLATKLAALGGQPNSAG